MVVEILEELEGGETFLFALNWIMKAKIFVKTPEIFYIRRNSPTSQSNYQIFSDKKVQKDIDSNIEIFRKVDKFVSEFDFFRDKKFLQYIVKAKIFMSREYVNFESNRDFFNKNYSELYHSIEQNFKKYFGDYGVYIALLYHWSHVMQLNNKNARKKLQECLNLISKDI